MKSSKILFGLTALALMAVVVSSAYACYLPPPTGVGLSPGYWKHNVKVYNGGPGSYSGDPTHETDASMEGYAAIIMGYFAPNPPGAVSAHDFLVWANKMFQDNAHKDMWLTIANWFNAASGRYPYSG